MDQNAPIRVQGVIAQFNVNGAEREIYYMGAVSESSTVTIAGETRRRLPYESVKNKYTEHQGILHYIDNEGERWAVLDSQAARASLRQGGYVEGTSYNSAPHFRLGETALAFGHTVMLGDDKTPVAIGDITNPQLHDLMRSALEKMAQDGRSTTQISSMSSPQTVVHGRHRVLQHTN